MKFATWVKNLRQNKGLTQSDFAELVGCSLQSIAYYENGSRYPALRVIKRLSELSNFEIKKIRQMIEREKKKNDNYK